MRQLLDLSGISMPANSFAAMCVSPILVLGLHDEFLQSPLPASTFQRSSLLRCRLSRAVRGLCSCILVVIQARLHSGPTAKVRAGRNAGGRSVQAHERPRLLPELRFSLLVKGPEVVLMLILGQSVQYPLPNIDTTGAE